MLHQAMTGGSLGGIGQMIMEALKKRRKKPIPPNMMVPFSPPRKAPVTIPAPSFQKRKPAKELRGLNQYKRWAY